MPILFRYIGLSVIKGFLIIALILVSLFAIILLIDELDDVGTGAYNWALAVQYVLLHTPKILFDFAAVISLIGSIVALGALANQHELIAIESLGSSPSRVTNAVLVTAVFLMMFVLMIAQFVIPFTSQEATVKKTLATEGQSGFISKGGYWSQKDNRFLHVKDIRYGRIPVNVEIFEFDDEHNLLRYIYAANVKVLDQQDWELHDVKVREVVNGYLSVYDQEKLRWKSFLNEKQVGIIISKPEALSLTDLQRFIKGLKERGEKSYRYELIFWQKLIIPVSAVIMILLGMRFVFGSQRGTSASKRITLGVLSGISFYVLTQVISHFGSSQGWMPFVTAISPSLLVLSVLLYLHFNKRVQT